MARTVTIRYLNGEYDENEFTTNANTYHDALGQLEKEDFVVRVAEYWIEEDGKLIKHG